MTDSQSYSEKPLETENFLADLSSSSTNTTLQRKPFIVVAMVLLVVSVVVLISLFYQNQKLSKEISLLKVSKTSVSPASIVENSSTTTTSPSATPSSLLGVTFIGYQSGKYKIHYPDTWTLNKTSTGLIVTNNDRAEMSISTTDKNAQGWSCEGKILSKVNIGSTVLDIREASPNTLVMCDGKKDYTVIGSISILSMKDIDQKTIDEFKYILEKIEISSEPDSATNWKPYTGTKHTFQYPDNWITDECSSSICLHAPDNSVALVLSVDSPVLKPEYFAQCEKVAKTESLMVQDVKMTKTLLIGVDSEFCGILTPNTHAMYKIENKNPKLEDLLDIRFNSDKTETVDKVISTFKFSNPQASPTTNIYSSPTLGIEFNYLPTYKIYNISEPQKFEGVTEKIWSVTLKSQKEAYITIRNMTPPDGGDCTEVLSTKKIKGVYYFDFVKIGQSKETYCSGGSGGISWYGVTGINDSRNKVLYVDTSTKDISEANIKTVEAAMLKVITSIKYTK